MGTRGERLGGIRVHILLPQLTQFTVEKYQDQHSGELGGYHDGHSQEGSFVGSFIGCANWGVCACVNVCVCVEEGRKQGGMSSEEQSATPVITYYREER